MRKRLVASVQFVVLLLREHTKVPGIVVAWVAIRVMDLQGFRLMLVAGLVRLVPAPLDDLLLVLRAEALRVVGCQYVIRIWKG